MSELRAGETAEGARFCNECASPLQDLDRAVGEERKVVTVLFVDLVGFTARAETLDPEDVRALLAPYHTHAAIGARALRGNGREVHRRCGDGALRRADRARGRPRAGGAGGARDPRLGVEQGEELQVRIAVNTGEALVTLGARPSEGESMAAG